MIEPSGIPGKIVEARHGEAVLVLSAERDDLTAMGVAAALGVRDMFGKAFLYDPASRTLKIAAGPSRS